MKFARKFQGFGGATERFGGNRRQVGKLVGIVLIAYLLICLLVGWY